MKGTENQTEFIILGPEDWYILFYEKEGYFPKKCEGYDYCVCFCYGNDVSECDNQGACSELKYKWDWKQSYKISEIPYTIKITK